MCKESDVMFATDNVATLLSVFADMLTIVDGEVIVFVWMTLMLERVDCVKFIEGAVVVTLLVMSVFVATFVMLERDFVETLMFCASDVIFAREIVLTLERDFVDTLILGASDVMLARDMVLTLERDLVDTLMF
jgi:hypothetical protein